MLYLCVVCLPSYDKVILYANMFFCDCTLCLCSRFYECDCVCSIGPVERTTHTHTGTELIWGVLAQDSAFCIYAHTHVSRLSVRTIIFMQGGYCDFLCPRVYTAGIRAFDVRTPARYALDITPSPVSNRVQHARAVRKREFGRSSGVRFPCSARRNTE